MKSVVSAESVVPRQCLELGAVGPVGRKEPTTRQERAAERRRNVLWAQLVRDLERRARQRYRGNGNKAGFPQPDDLALHAFAKVKTAYGERYFDDRSVGEAWTLAYKALHNLFLDALDKKGEELPHATESATGILEGRPASCPSPEREARVNERRARVGLCLVRHFSAQEQQFVRSWARLDSAPAAQRECGWPPGVPSNANKTLERILRRLGSLLRVRLDPETIREFERR